MSEGRTGLGWPLRSWVSAEGRVADRKTNAANRLVRRFITHLRKSEKTSGPTLATQSPCHCSTFIAQQIPHVQSAAIARGGKSCTIPYILSTRGWADRLYTISRN